MEHRKTTTQNSKAADLNRLLAIYDEWLNLFPWNVPALTPYREAAERDKKQAAQDFQDVMSRPIENPYPDSDPDFLDVDDFGYWLTSRTRFILQKANENITESSQTEQGAILAALLEAKRDHKTDFENVCDQMADPCILQGLRADFDLIRAWIDDNIRYLESMQVKPRRAGDVVERETEEPRPMTEQPAPPQPETKYKGIVYALAYIIDKKATGQPIPPGRVPMETDVFRHYKQFKVSKNTVYKNKNILIKKTITPALCFEIAGENWLQVIVGLSNNPEKVKQYIENDILIK